MKEYFKKLISMIIATAILIGIPYLFGEGWLVISWLPALIAFILMDT